ncbi:MAG: DUF4215 domain-containing protein [bacterium]
MANRTKRIASVSSSGPVTVVASASPSASASASAFASALASALLLLGTSTLLVACSDDSGDDQGVCGDGRLDPEEQCDGRYLGGETCLSAAGHQEGDPTCTSECELDISDCRTCGDAQVHGAEGCDDGNVDDGDGCSAACEVESGWECSGVPSLCTPTCGNGQIGAAEECDDGNQADGDGCGADCRIEPGYSCQGEPSVCGPPCGDGVISVDEECDDGNQADGDGCSADCEVVHGWQCSGEPSSCQSTCGDGIIAIGAEQCDDLNAADSDGCSSTCQIEDFSACHEEPSYCYEVVYVDMNPVPGVRTGATWATALATIQEGLTEAAGRPGAEIWVAEGTYHIYPSSLVLGADNSLFGSFAGTEAWRGQRDLITHVTTLDGESPTQPGNHVEHVIRADPGASGAVDGFTITGGRSSTHGGGLYSVDSNVFVSRVHFTQNQAVDHGGAVYASGGYLWFQLCGFSENTASEGGAVYLDNSYTNFEYSHVLNNTAYLGGGMRADAGAVVWMSNMVFGNNHSTADGSGGGGGGFAADTTDATIVNSTFSDNTSAFPNTGAGIANTDTNLLLVNSIVWGPGSQLLCSPAGLCDVTYSHISGGFVGTGNASSNPLLVNPSGGDFRLGPGSPCIDSANGDLAPVRDVVLIPRLDDPAVPNTGTGTPNYADRGAYEHVP